MAKDFERLQRTYDELVGLYAPRPLHNDADYDNAIKVVDQLAGHNLTVDQEDYLVAVSTFVEEYEEDRCWAEGTKKALAEFKQSGEKAIAWDDIKSEFLNGGGKSAFEQIRNGLLETIAHTKGRETDKEKDPMAKTRKTRVTKRGQRAASKKTPKKMKEAAKFREAVAKALIEIAVASLVRDCAAPFRIKVPAEGGPKDSGKTK